MTLRFTIAGLAEHRLREYPADPEPVATASTATRIGRDAEGEVAAPDRPGLGIEIDWDGVRRYLIDAEIKISGTVLCRTPEI